MGILDDSGENYIGAQRRDSGHLDMISSLTHQASVHSLADSDLPMANLQLTFAEDQIIRQTKVNFQQKFNEKACNLSIT